MKQKFARNVFTSRECELVGLFTRDERSSTARNCLGVLRARNGLRSAMSRCPSNGVPPGLTATITQGVRGWAVVVVLGLAVPQRQNDDGAR